MNKSVFQLKENLWTKHAIERYRERVRPALSLDDARKELNQLLPVMDLVTPDKAPEWLTLEESESYLLLGNDVAFSIKNGKAVTCVAKGTLAKLTRAKRNNNRRRKRGSFNKKKIDMASRVYDRRKQNNVFKEDLNG